MDKVGVSDSMSCRRPAPRSRGVTLIETLACVVLTAAAAVALGGFFVSAFQCHTRSRSQWEASVWQWNRVEELRAARAPEGDLVHLIPGARPLYRFVVRPPSGVGRPWEVLRAQK
jgi:hypothetical protein